MRLYILQGSLDWHDKIIGANAVETLDELYSCADFISFNCPLTEETKGIIDFKAAYLSSKKPLSIINTARGCLSPSICEICEAIREGLIYSYDTDELPCEPPSTMEPELLRDPLIRSRLTVTPHTAFYSQESFLEMRSKAALNLVAEMHLHENSYQIL